MNRFLLILLAATVACGTPEPETEPSVGEPVAAPGPEGMDETVVVARLAARIKADPERAAVLLEEAGMSSEDFQDELWKIAEDPARSAVFEAEMGGM